MMLIKKVEMVEHVECKGDTDWVKYCMTFD